MKELQEKQINQYLAGEMSPIELVDFQKLLDTSPELAEAVQLERLALQAIRLAGRERLLSHLKGLKHPVDSDVPNVNNRSSMSPWLLLFLTSLVLGSLCYFFCNGETKTEEGGKKPNENSSLNGQGNQPQAVAKLDSAELITENVTKSDKTKQRLTETTSTPIKSAPNHQKTEAAKAQKALFASNFKPSAHRNLNLIVRGDSDSSTRSKFEDVYARTRYDSVLILWQQLPKEEQRTPLLSFAYGNALMAQGSINEAVPYFEFAKSNKQYTAESIWYLALIALNQGDLEKSKIAFKAIAQTNDSVYQEKAKTIVAALGSL